MLAWATTAGQERIYLSDRKFQKLSLDVQCDVHLHNDRLDNWTASHCVPYYDKYDDQSLTTTGVFFEMLGGGSFDKAETEQESATSFVTLLGNLMMNGMHGQWSTNKTPLRMSLNAMIYAKYTVLIL